MRKTPVHTQERQDRALILALSGTPLPVIASALGYETSASAWKATRAAIARRKTSCTPAQVQERIAIREKHYRRRGRSMALRDVLFDTDRQDEGR